MADRPEPESAELAEGTLELEASGDAALAGLESVEERLPSPSPDVIVEPTPVPEHSTTDSPQAPSTPEPVGESPVPDDAAPDSNRADE